MHLFELGGKVAIVTGGTSGIGLGMARGLLEAGASVAVAGRNEEKGAAVVAELQSLGGEVAFFPADIGNADDCRSLVSGVAEHFGTLDILINNAGMNIAKFPQDYTLEEWQRVIDVNLTSAFILSQSAYPLFKRAGAGKIINTGSMMTLFGGALAAAYGASKGGIGQLTKSLATAWAPDNIQVNGILPGFVDSELTRQARAQRPDFEQRVVGRTPMGRFGTPSDCAGIAVFLASSASDFVTGALIPLDGGYSSQG